MREVRGIAHGQRLFANRRGVTLQIGRRRCLLKFFARVSQRGDGSTGYPETRTPRQIMQRLQEDRDIHSSPGPRTLRALVVYGDAL